MSTPSAGGRCDAQEPLREPMHAKLQTPEGQAIYNRRMHLGESPFAVIKGVLEVRRFLLRGLEKVQTEWTWVCTACNVKKLIAFPAALRAECGVLATEATSQAIEEDCGPNHPAMARRDPPATGRSVD